MKNAGRIVHDAIGIDDSPEEVVGKPLPDAGCETTAYEEQTAVGHDAKGGVRNVDWCSEKHDVSFC